MFMYIVLPMYNYISKSPGGGIGRHKGLKIPRQQWRAGSSPAPGTILAINIKF